MWYAVTTMSAGDSTSDERLRPPRIPPILRQPSPTGPIISVVSPAARRGRRRTIYLLATASFCLAFVSSAPAVLQFNEARWPLWAEITVGVGVLQVAYAIWLLTVTDWATVRVLMLVQALVATLYGAGLMIAIATPADQIAYFDLDGVRGPARWWCLLLMCLAGTLSFVCGRISHRWRRGNSG